MNTSAVFFSFFDCDTSVAGDLEFAGTLRIDGNLHGGIRTSDTLIIGETATIEADISVGEIRIFGTVLGNIESQRTVEICAGGILRGDVRTPRLIIREGALFDGCSHPTADSSLNAIQESGEQLGDAVETAALPLQVR